MPLDDGAGAGVQRPGTAIVAEPLPGVQDVGLVRRGERLEAGEAREERRESGAHGRDRGLLEHELAQQHLVRRGRGAGRGAPRQLAPMRVVPGEQSIHQPRRRRFLHRLAPPPRPTNLK